MSDKKDSVSIAPGAPGIAPRWTSSAKEVIGEPHSSVVLMRVKLEILDHALRDKLKLYVLMAPHIKNTGEHNSAETCELGGQHLLHAQRDDVHLIVGCKSGFTKRSVGFVGVSDGWRDLMHNFQMDWQYERAHDGNLAMIGEVDLTHGSEFTVGVAMGYSRQSAATQLLQAFLWPFAAQRAKYIEQWKRTSVKNPLFVEDKQTTELVRLSQCVLLAHEDKTFAGATVASMTIPWGETKDDSDQGGYHLVWARDMMQTTTALMACGEVESPLRALTWLACVQNEDGCMPQNSSINGTAYWKSLQLDEVAAPIILAWRLMRAGALQEFDPWIVVSRAARFLILNGPVTTQERWEENSGYSPSTLAALIAALICASDFADRQGYRETGDFLRDYADWMAASLEAWTVTGKGELVEGHPQHYIRITPPAPHSSPAAPDPDAAMIQIANGGGEHPARNVVDGGFLQLVRMGIRAADDPIIVESVAVIDKILKRDLPQGPCWRRYNHDGYGQKADGSAFDGTGEGRSWPLLTGERGHYELAAGRDPLPYIKSIEGFANVGGLLTEQLWDAEDLPEHEMRFGQPTGSAMPLCWAHAEYICLVRSHADGECFDRIETVYQRYAVNKTDHRIQVWTLAHPLSCAKSGKPLRIICDNPASIHWSADNWQTSQDIATHPNSLGLHFVDIPCVEGSGQLAFTFHWSEQVPRYRMIQRVLVGTLSRKCLKKTHIFVTYFTDMLATHGLP